MLRHLLEIFAIYLIFLPKHDVCFEISVFVWLFVGGVLANSLAIATDAAHLLTDFASFLISLFALVLASRPRTKRMNFGWYRAGETLMSCCFRPLTLFTRILHSGKLCYFANQNTDIQVLISCAVESEALVCWLFVGVCFLSEVMGALLSVLLIWVVTGVLVYLAIQRVITQDYEIDAQVMLITAAVGVFFNLMSVFFFCHSPSAFCIYLINYLTALWILKTLIVFIINVY